jgi:CheY-like chemotaxis protein
MAQILFVDDDAITLEILAKAAEVLGHQSILCNTSEQALIMAAERHPDLIMLDMMMPDMDGLSILSRLREQPGTAGIPIVMLSAGVNLNDDELAQQAGAQGYLTKPVSLKTLLDTISKFTIAK